jgi:hypothetical protein
MALGGLIIVDPDALGVGNLTRHILTMRQIGNNKASAVAARLNLASPYAKLQGLGSSIENLEASELQEIVDADLVWDCSGSDDVFCNLEGIAWTSNPIIHSLSISFGARRLFVYSQRAPLSYSQFADRLQPWLAKDLKERGNEELPREGIGCFHPVFPASAVDIHLMVATALKSIASRTAFTADPSFQVFEQIIEGGEFLGVRKVEG